MPRRRRPARGDAPAEGLARRRAGADDTLLHGFFAQVGAQLYGRDIAVSRANDPAELARPLLTAGRPPPALRFDCGPSDGLLAQNRTLDVALTQLRVPHVYHEYPGAHSWRYWNTHLRESLPWMLGVIGRQP